MQSKDAVECCYEKQHDNERIIHWYLHRNYKTIN